METQRHRKGGKRWQSQKVLTYLNIKNTAIIIIVIKGCVYNVVLHSRTPASELRKYPHLKIESKSRKLVTVIT